MKGIRVITDEEFAVWLKENYPDHSSIDLAFIGLDQLNRKAQHQQDMKNFLAWLEVWVREMGERII